MFKSLFVYFSGPLGLACILFILDKRGPLMRHRSSVGFFVISMMNSFNNTEAVIFPMQAMLS